MENFARVPIGSRRFARWIEVLKNYNTRSYSSCIRLINNVKKYVKKFDCSYCMGWSEMSCNDCVLTLGVNCMKMTK